MLPDRVSNPGPLTYESGALPIALRGPADFWRRGVGRTGTARGNICYRHNFPVKDVFRLTPERFHCLGMSSSIGFS